MQHPVRHRHRPAQFAALQGAAFGQLRPFPTTTSLGVFSRKRSLKCCVERLMEMLGIDIGISPGLGTAVRITARIEDHDVTDKILIHLDAQSAQSPTPGALRPPSRAPPQLGQGCYDQGE